MNDVVLKTFRELSKGRTIYRLWEDVECAPFCKKKQKLFTKGEVTNFVYPHENVSIPNGNLPFLIARTGKVSFRPCTIEKMQFLKDLVRESIYQYPLLLVKNRLSNNEVIRYSAHLGLGRLAGSGIDSTIGMENLIHSIMYAAFQHYVAECYPHFKATIDRNLTWLYWLAERKYTSDIQKLLSNMGSEQM